VFQREVFLRGRSLRKAGGSVNSKQNSEAKGKLH
jgi:hypothetical protein